MKNLRPVIALLLLAPVCAEYLSAYLPQTGQVVVLLTGLLVLSPLYGCAAILIHEIAARTGRGWRGILLLGAAYGVLQAGVIDLSLVTRERTDVAEWSDIVEPTAMSALGVSAYPIIAWVIGHAVLSISAPLAIVEAFSGKDEPRKPWLRGPGTVVMTAAFAIAAVLIHLDQPPTAHLGSGQLAAFLGASAALALGALTRAGIPVQPGSTPERGGVLLAAGILGQIAFDCVPPYWAGVAIAIVLVGCAWFVADRRARRRWISPTAVGCLAAGAICGRVLIGTIAPAAPGVSEIERLGQAATFVAAAAVLGVLMLRLHRWSTGREATSA